MFTQISYSRVVVTDTAVDAIGTVVQISPTVRLANRQGVEIVNCTTGNIRIAQISESSGAPTLDSTHFDTELAPSAVKTFGAMPNVRFYIYSSGGVAGNVRLLEYC